MKIDFNNFRFNCIASFNQVVNNTDFTNMEDCDLCDWHDLRNNLATLVAIEPNIFDQIKIADIRNIDE